MIKEMQKFDRRDLIMESVIRIDLLTFFQANPHTRDTINGLALRLHRPFHQVKEALNALSALGILEVGGSEKMPVYRLRNGDLISKYFSEQGAKGIRENSMV